MPRHSLRCVFVAAAFALLAMPAPRADETPLSVRITSPLGRIGAHTNMRVVAQVQTASNVTVLPVRFYVDGTLYKTDEDGPPYAIEWVDENPFERRELAVEVEDMSGRKVRDAIVLEPFDIVEETEVSSVLLEASVYDKRGRFVNALDASSFAVQEDGVTQTIDVVNHEELPAVMAILVDSSHSMHRRVGFVRDGVRRLLDFLRPADRVIVAPFSTHLEAITGPTNHRDTVLQAVSQIKASGGTAILDSLSEIVRAFPSGLGRRAVVLITDGYDEDSVTPIEQVVEAVKAAQVTVYVVAIGGVAGVSRKGEQTLRRLATDTGGQIFMPRDEGLVRVHERLAEDVQNRYLVTYTPTNQKKDGTWRQVRLTTSPEYVVRTRTGYAAPRPPPVRPQLEFTISDKNRGYQNLSASDLVVVEDGVEQKVEAFHELVAPVSIVLALDSSGSMRRSVSDAIEAARRFVLALRPEDALALMTFADGVTAVHDLTTVRDTTLKGIDAYTAVGGTALYDALWDSVMRLSRVEGRRSVVVVSDGRDEDNPGTGPGSLRSKDQVLALIRQVDVTIYAIGLGPKVDRPFLEELAGRSGGEAYFPSAVDALHEDYRRVVETLRRRFVLSYTSTNTVRNGAWREVDIRPKSPEIIVTSRGGYFAPDR